MMLGTLDYVILLSQYFLLMLPFLKFWLKWVQRDSTGQTEANLEDRQGMSFASIIKDPTQDS